MSDVLAEVAAERRRQDARFGPIPGLLGIQDGTGRDDHLALLEIVRLAGEPRTMAEILEEEVAEALAETKPEPLRAELVQVAAVAVKWVEIIDARAAAGQEAPRG